jgi:hypothetical protein
VTEGAWRKTGRIINVSYFNDYADKSKSTLTQTAQRLPCCLTIDGGCIKLAHSREWHLAMSA